MAMEIAGTQSVGQDLVLSAYQFKMIQLGKTVIMLQLCKAFLDSSMHKRREQRASQISLEGLLHLLMHWNFPWQCRCLWSQHFQGDFCEYLLLIKYRWVTNQHGWLILSTEPSCSRNFHSWSLSNKCCILSYSKTHLSMAYKRRVRQRKRNERENRADPSKQKCMFEHWRCQGSV